MATTRSDKKRNKGGKLDRKQSMFSQIPGNMRKDIPQLEKMTAISSRSSDYFLDRPEDASYKNKSVKELVQELKASLKLNKDLQKQVRSKKALWKVVFVVLIALLAQSLRNGYFQSEFVNLGRMGDNFTDTLTQQVYDSVKHLLPNNKFVDYGDLGKRLLKEGGVQLKHPVVLMPGFSTTTLNVWKRSDECRDSLGFLDVVAGDFMAAVTIMKHVKCWVSHMSLDLESGRDPNGISVRSGTGIDASMSFGPLFWVWTKIVENLLEIGYTKSTMYMASYDWRMNAENLEKRDKFFTNLKFQVEVMLQDSFHNPNHEKVVVMCHSMGSNVWFYFMKWVEDDAWIEKHIHAVSNIGGPMLGMPKSLSAVLSGEIKDTSKLGVFNELFEFTDNGLSKSSRTQMFQTWGCLQQMLPKGGKEIWGVPITGYSEGGSMEVVEKHYPKLFKVLVNKYSNSYVDDDVSMADNDAKKWYNPLETTLPLAKSLTIYSLYGIGSDTEIGFRYMKTDYNRYMETDLNNTSFKTPLHINLSYHAEDEGYSYGVLYEKGLNAGDGTIPLVSLGYMSAVPWRTKKHNPAGARIVTREMKHAPHPLYPRGGPLTSDHVDILGNVDLIEDILRIASGEQLKDKIFSNIKEQSRNIYNKHINTT